MTDDIAKAREWMKAHPEYRGYLDRCQLAIMAEYAAQRVKEATEELQGLIVTHEICNQQMKKALAEKDAEIERLRKHAKQLGDLAEVHADDACTKAIEIEQHWKKLRKIFDALPPGPRCRDCADAIVGGYGGRCMNSDVAFCDPADEAARMLREYPGLNARIAALEAVAEAARDLSKAFKESCRYDHHGYCQAHFLEEDCSVARLAKSLAALDKEKSDG